MNNDWSVITNGKEKELNEWKEAVLDAIANTGGDIPITFTARKAVDWLVKTNVEMCLDRRISLAADKLYWEGYDNGYDTAFDIYYTEDER